MRKKTLPDSRFWNETQTASRLGRSISWFSQNYARLRQLGFPAKDEAVGGFPKDRVEAWIDERAGIIRPDSEEAQILAMLNDKLARMGQHGAARA